jgi:hypothetical protein
MAQLKLAVQLNWSLLSSEEDVEFGLDEAREIKIMQGCISGS